jgi:putative cell wall-binding protein
MERVKALADKFNQQLAQNADSAALRQTAIQILAELEAMPTVETLPNNVSVIMPSVDYALAEPMKVIEPIKVEETTIAAEPILMTKPKEVFVEEKPVMEVPKTETIETKKEVAEKIALQPIKDLRAAIGINDKFQFMEELFNKDEALFESSIKTINAYKNFAEAQFWIKQNLRNKFNWEEESATVIAFDQLVKRRFS